MADLSITAANVAPSLAGIGNRKSAIAAVAITAGQYLYKLAAVDSVYSFPQVGLADSNGTSPANSIEGCAINNAGAGQIVDYVPADANFNTGASAVALGATAYLSDTPGGITVTYADIASGSTVIVLGNYISATNMNFAPIVGGVKP